VVDPETGEAPDRDRDRDTGLTHALSNAHPHDEHSDATDDEGNPERRVVQHVLDVVHGP
jgi:hypothetical protein